MSTSLEDQKLGVLLKYANHRKECNCFICRNLTLEERNLLDMIWNAWIDGMRKA